MSDDLVEGWDNLKENLPSKHDEAAELLFDYGDKLADRIEALEAVKRDARNEALREAADRFLETEVELTGVEVKAVILALMEDTDDDE